MTTRSINFLPDIFKTPANRKFLNATVDQLVAEPDLRKINGYVGRKFAPTYKQSDNYLIEDTADRQNYQLEPCVVSTDSEENIQFLSSYHDLIQKIQFYGGVTNNHSRLFANEAYTFDGLVDFDKLVNFSQYYWMPSGPEPVDVYAGGVDLEQDYTVTRDEQLNAYTISGFGTAENPDLVLARGGRYTFKVNQEGDAFWIQTTPGINSLVSNNTNISSRDVYGVDDNGASNGTVVFNVPLIDEQDYFINMPKSDANFATTLNFTDLQHKLLQNMPNGIDSVTSQFDGKTVIFVNNDRSDTAWENKGVYALNVYDKDSNPSDSLDEDPYDRGAFIPVERRSSVWRINIINVDGNQLVELTWLRDIPVESRVLVTSGTEFANIEFYKNTVGDLVKVPLITAPLKQLYYNDGKDQRFYGRITIVNADNTSINVQESILGKKEYTSPNGVVFTNGLKVRFNSAAMPVKYSDSICYVEGVGTGIRLALLSELITPETSNAASIPFDVYGFSDEFFDQSLNGPLTPDYLTINRSSIDANIWSRGNRWFHNDVILATAKYNKVVPVFDQANRATRPIIEFDADLQLSNHGKIGKHVDVLDFTITDAFNEVELAQSGFFKTANFRDGMTIIFANDNDPIVRNQIFKVNVLKIGGLLKIHLTEVADGNILAYDSVVPLSGCTVLMEPWTGAANLTLNPIARKISLDNKLGLLPLDGVLSPTVGLLLGYSFWFNGTAWVKSQQKASVNSAPKFDILDEAGISFSDTSHYVNSTFAGCTIFSYKLGTGTNDTVLGFPISHRNFNNVGDIEFENTFDSGSFEELVNKVTVSHRLNIGTPIKIVTRDTSNNVNIWTTLAEKTKQYQIISNICDGTTSYFEIDIAPAAQQASPTIKVYVNNVQLSTSDFSIVAVGARSAVLVSAALALNDKVDILIYSPSTSNFGYYEIPQNLDFNPLNEDFTSLTLGQFRNHLVSMSTNNSYVVGQVPGASNLRDLTVKSSGGSILQHSAPAIYSSLFLLEKDINFIDSITFAQLEYQKFKTRFLESAISAINAGVTEPAAAVDFILHNLNEVKNVSNPWYYSDMVPYDQNRTDIDYIVLNTELTEYEIDTIFNDAELSSKAVLVYLNGTQLMKGIDYTFNQTRPSVIFSSALEYDDLIKIVIYHNTDGCYIPETPTKLGLYPKFTPSVYADTTYQNPVEMIRGHDGSLTPKFGDLRDALLLELEKRIYNNIKATYDHSNFDINDVIPGKFRDTNYSIDEYNQIVSRCFLNWVSSTRIDYSTNDWFASNNPWTWNYSRFRDIGGELMPGFWRGAYKYFYDTDAPHERPWECLGFSEMPLWWVETYGPAPYTGGNLVLWGDLEAGLIRHGDRAGIDPRYARPGLSSVIPVTDSGELKSPNQVLTTLASGSDAAGSFAIGDHGPIESAWRNSSAYPFAVQQAVALMVPARYFGQLATIHHYSKSESVNQFVQHTTKQRITPTDFIINGKTTRNAGYLNWIADYITSYGSDPTTKITGYLNTLSTRLGYKVAGFTDKAYLRVLAEQSSPGSTNDSIIIPDDNYTIYLHKSSPVDRIVYSAVIIEKTASGFSISGYNSENPIFTIIPSDANSNQHVITTGESTGVVYHNYQSVKITVPYGYEFRNKQQIVDFLISYGRYLTSQGFKFETFNQDLGEQMDWELAAKEFLTWTEQGWAPGNIIVVSPVANAIEVTYDGAVVDKVDNLPLGSKILDIGFNIIRPSLFNITREGAAFSLTTEAEVSIGLLDLSLVQYEHVLVFDNTTLFNDIIYKPALGNRQYRLKMIGNKTSSWDGQLTAPGFVFNDSKINSWNPGQDYRKGELVTFKTAIYTALQFVVASDTFVYAQWKQIDKATLKSGLLPNFAYNAKKFENMYDVDNQILDQNINAYSNGLLGYRERRFLSDLSVNPTSQAKFYQGYIRDKGTKDSITALSTATFNNLTGNVQFNEEWAFRVGEYGATESNQFVEVQLKDDQFKFNPLAISFLNPGEVSESEVVGVYKNTLYKKPLSFTTNIFATRNDDSIYENDIKTAGYVNINDIDATIFDITNYTSNNALVAKIHSGFKIWVAKDVNRDWNVYRVDETSVLLTEISYALDGLAYFNMFAPHLLEVGDMFAVRNFSTEADGFYRVVRVEDVNSVVVAVTSQFEEILTSTPFLEGNGTVFKLNSVRFASKFAAIQYTPLNGWKDTDKIWVDSFESKWAVYSKTMPWKFTSTLQATEDAAESQYGQNIAVSSDGRLVVASSPGIPGNKIHLSVKVATGEFVYSTADIEVPSSTATVGSALAITSKSIAYSNEEDVNQSSITVLSLSGSNIVGTDSVFDSIPLSFNRAVITNVGFGYTAKPTISVTNQFINTPLGLVLDEGAGLDIEVEGYSIDGTTSGVRQITLDTAGAGYTTDDIILVSITGAKGIGASGVVTSHVVPGNTAPVSKVQLLTPGTGYTSQPTVSITGDGAGATASIIGALVPEVRSPVVSVGLTSPGTGYTSKPNISISSDGIGAVVDIIGEMIPESLGSVTSVTLISQGAGMTAIPTVTITGGDGTGATASPVGTLVGGGITSATLVRPGTGYKIEPTVVVSGSPATPAVIRVDGVQHLDSFTVTGLTVLDAGLGYETAPTVTLVDSNMELEVKTLTKTVSGAGGKNGTSGTITNLDPTLNAWVHTPTLLRLTSPKLYAFNNLFICPDNGQGNPNVSVSPDGINWVTRKVYESSSRAYGLELGNIVVVRDTMYALAKQSGTTYNYTPITDNSVWLVTSKDGISWTSETTNILPIISGSSTSMCHNGTLFASIQKIHGANYLATRYIMMTSTDGILWNNSGDVQGDILVASGNMFVVTKSQSIYVSGNGNPLNNPTGFDFWASNNATTWVQHIFTPPALPVPGVNSTNFYSMQSDMTVANGRIFVKIAKSEEYTSYSPAGYTTSTTNSYYLASTVDFQNWNMNRYAIGSGSVFNDFIYGATSTALTNSTYYAPQQIAWNGQVYIMPVIVGHSFGNQNKASLGYTTESTVMTSSDLVTWHSVIVATDNSWTVVASLGTKVCILGGNSNSSLLSPASLTNYNVTGGTGQVSTGSTSAENAAAAIINATFVTTSKVVTTSNVQFLKGSNLYTDPISYGYGFTTVASSTYTLTGLTLVTSGSGYRVPPIVTITGGTTQATAIAETNYSAAFYNIEGVALIAPGSNYLATPVIQITPSIGAGSGATAIATVNANAEYYRIDGILFDSVTDGGAGYSANPVATIIGNGSGATARASVTLPIIIDGVSVTNTGAGYTDVPSVIITPPANSPLTPATATAVVDVVRPYIITGATITTPGTGYLVPPLLTVVPSNGNGQNAAASLTTISSRFGTSIVMSDDDQWMFVSAPAAGIVQCYKKTSSSVTIDSVTFNGIDELTIVGTASGDTKVGDLVTLRIFDGTYYATVDSLNGFTATALIVPNPVTGGRITSVVATASINGTGLTSVTINATDTAPYIYSIVSLTNSVTPKFRLVTSVTGLKTAGFGFAMATNSDASMLVVGAYKSNVGTTLGAGIVYIYYRVGTNFALQQKINPPAPMIGGKFGYSLCIRNNGDELLIGSPNYSESVYKNGIVYRYSSIATSKTPFVFTQEIRKPYTEFIEHFGTAIAADNNVSSILVSSNGAYSINMTSIDKTHFYLDGGTTSIIDRIQNAGAVYVYDLIVDTDMTAYSFNQQLDDANITSGDNFGASIAIRPGLIVVGSSTNDATRNNAGRVAWFENATKGAGWTLTRQQKSTVDLDNVTRMYLYNRKSQAIVTNLDYIDPAKGKILGTADQDISFKTTFDPAIYNAGTSSNVTINPGFYWAAEHVGKVWWDLDTICYIDYEQDSIAYRNKQWGRKFPDSTVDVFEWVESDGLPSQYVTDGVAKYDDNSAYVVHNVVDPFTGIVQVKYYFWVKNKTTVPAIASRRVSVASIANMIDRPEDQEIPYAAILQSNSVSLVNSESFISADDTILHIDYSLLANTNIIHNEYELVSEGTDNAVIPAKIINKLVDSLAGTDKFGNLVPDYKLGASERYGTGTRPRQTMIVNRLTSVKNLCQFVNNAFSTVPVCEQFSLTTLYSSEEAPAEGITFKKNPKDPNSDDILHWNIKVDSLAERSYYDKDLLIPGQRILVVNDATFNNQWAIYLINSDKSFSLVRTQGFYTPDYWERIDWYAASYDPTVKPTYTVATYKDISTLTLKPTNSIKVTNNGDGRFAVYVVGYDLSLALVGVEAGTIRLQDSLWAHNTNSIGFGNDNFDTVKFDMNPDIELRIILTAVKDVFFKNSLDGQFNKLFFVLLNYIMSEQRMIDWAFKTSFVSIIHKLRKLEQFPNYIKDNQSYYEDYINEVKPYRTKIREYIIDYEGSDDADLYPTDFDLPSYYDTDLAVWRSPSGEHARDNTLLSTDLRYTAWKYNHGYTIQSVQVTSPGIGYAPPSPGYVPPHGIRPGPKVTVLIDGNIATPDLTADMEAVVDFYTGSILKVIVYNPGVKHYTTPTIQINGDGVYSNGTQSCVLYPILANNTVRRISSKIKFDRVTYDSPVKQWAKNLTLVAADIVSYNSKAYRVNATSWAANTLFNKGTIIYVGDVLYFAIDNVTTAATFDSAMFGLFTTGPFFIPDQYVLISDDELANAADRAMALYTPTVGMPPKELARLFHGIDYPGNLVDGSKYVGDLEQDTNIQSFFKDLELGTRPEDIDVDGGAYIDVFSSHAPEELLPGRIYDTLDIKVFTVDPADPTKAPIGFRISKTMASGFTFGDITIDENQTGFDQDKFAKSVAWEFRRIAADATTTLARDLLIGDTFIYVTDASVLQIPHPRLNMPGVIYINGEKITYYTIDNVTGALGQLRRGVWGTGSPAVQPAGSKVVDAGVDQQIPGDAAMTTWLHSIPSELLPPADHIDPDASIAYLYGDGLWASETPQAMFLKGSLAYQPGTPSDLSGWHDPEVNTSSFDQSTPVRPFDSAPFDSKTIE